MPKNRPSAVNKRHSGEWEAERRVESDFFYLSNGIAEPLGELSNL